jgi:hypothetical protein
LKKNKVKESLKHIRILSCSIIGRIRIITQSRNNKIKKLGMAKKIFKCSSYFFTAPYTGL